MKTSAPVGSSIGSETSPFLRNNGRLTNQPTNLPTDRQTNEQMSSYGSFALNSSDRNHSGKILFLSKQSVLLLSIRANKITTSSPIGTMEVKLLPFLRNAERPTNQPTDRRILLWIFLFLVKIESSIV